MGARYTFYKEVQRYYHWSQQNRQYLLWLTGKSTMLVMIEINGINFLVVGGNEEENEDDYV